MHDVAYDCALLVLRLALGMMLAGHGLNKVFGQGGLDGTTRWFESLGFRPAWLHARLAATTEIGAGVLMCLGLFQPVASAAFVGLMLVAALTDHRGKGFFVFKGGWEYVAIVAVAAVCVAALGPGRWAIDYAVAWYLAGLGWAAASLVLGFAGAGLLLATTRPHHVVKGS